MMPNSRNLGYHGDDDDDDDVDSWSITDEVKELLALGYNGQARISRRLTPDDFFRGLIFAIEQGRKESSHRILDRIERANKDGIPFVSIPYRELLECAVRCHMTSMVKRLAGTLHDENSCLLTSLRYGNVEITEVLLEAGCCPNTLLGYWLHSMWWEDLQLSEEQKGAWKPLLEHWTVQDVLQSVFVKSAMYGRQGSRVLTILEDIGMNFTAVMTLRASHAAANAMLTALALLDHSTVRFLIDRGFDISTSFNVSPLPLMHHFVSRGRFYDITFHGYDDSDDLLINFGRITLDLLREGANPLLRDKKGKNALELFISRFRIPTTQSLRQYDQKCFLVLTRVLLLSGFRAPKADLQTVPRMEGYIPVYFNANLSKLVAQNRTVPTLKSLTGMKIRLDWGRKTSEFMDHAQFPQLKDFVLLKHINLKKIVSALEVSAE